MSGVLRWEEPPASRRGKGDALASYVDAAEALRGSPGRWALLAVVAQHAAGGLAVRIKSGVGPFAPAGSFDAVTRMQPRNDGEPRQIGVYARYVGTGGAS